MIVLDYQDRRPLYEQIVEKFRILILRGILEPDAQMPPVRRLAMELSINPNTIQRAYTELERQGLIYPIKGRGSFVSANQTLQEERRKEVLARLKAVIQEARDNGLELSAVQEVIETVYKERTD